jgi:integrase
VIRVRLRGINKVRKRLADGTRRVYFYHRATGERLEGTPGSPEFVASWQAAESKIPDTNRHKGTFAELMNNYRASDGFAGLRDSTRRDYLKQIAKIETEFGDLPIKALRDPRIRADFLDWRDRLAETSRRQADYAMTVLGVICQWAVNRGVLATNPAAKPGRRYQADRTDKIWSPDQIEAFLKVASPELALAMMLAVETAQRQADLLLVSWNAFDGESITLTQSKPKKRTTVTIPVTDALRPWLEAAPRRATTILTRPDGRPWKADNFRHHWGAATRLAGCTGLTFHDLRGTAITRLAEAGCLPGEIASISGHSLKSVASILDAYQARTATQSKVAIMKLERSRTRQTANRNNKPRLAVAGKGGGK